MVVVNFDITFVMNCTVSKHLVPEKSALLIIFKREALLCHNFKKISNFDSDYQCVSFCIQKEG